LQNDSADKSKESNLRIALSKILFLNSTLGFCMICSAKLCKNLFPKKNFKATTSSPSN